jgi:MoaA/NifB/PqqE/SkfB family radical SAM enzyme
MERFEINKDTQDHRNIALNNIEITQGKKILESMPRRLGVTLTTRCNLRCIMCNIYKVPWDISERTVKEIIEYFPYLRYIMWLGGEVFLSSYFDELFDKAAMYPKLKQVIFTSGILIDETWAKKLVNGNIMLSYSIDGFTKKTYETIRKGASFEDLLESIDIITKYKKDYNSGVFHPDKFTTGINVTVMKSNYHEIEMAIDFAKRYDFDLVTLNSIDGLLESENIFFQNDAEFAEYVEKVMPAVIHKAKNYGITLNTWLPKIERPSSSLGSVNIQDRESKSDCDERDCSVKNKGILCHLPWQHLFIDPGGKVRPFCLCKKEIGDINKNSLKEIWNGEAMQFYRQKILDDDCLDLCNSRCTSGIIPENELKIND